MKTRLLFFGIALVSVACLLNASDVPKDFKQKLEQHYQRQKVAVVPAKVLIGLINWDATWVSPFNVNYDHFHSSVTMPKGYKNRNNLDERTTEEVQEGAGRVDYLEPGEILKIDQVKIWKRAKEYYAVDINLISLAGKRLTYGSESNVGTVKKDYGVHFRFAFAPEIIEGGQYDVVVGEINKYFLPEAEYREAAVAEHKAQGNVEIQPGMSKEDVLKALGDPQKTITFGKKTILKYQDLTIELEENKVVGLKTN